MPDTFTETTRNSWGLRIGSAFGGIIIGFIFFFVSFVVLYMNEGKVNLAKMAETSMHIENLAAVTEAENGKFISITGEVTSEEELGDTYLAQGQYLGIARTEEVYAWEETTSETSETKLGGSEEVTTTYSYEKVWTAHPQKSSGFKIPEGHENVHRTLKSQSASVKTADIEGYTLRVSSLSLPSFSDITLTSENIIPSEDYSLASPGFLYAGSGTLQNPQIGDVRISYTGLAYPLERATVFGKINVNAKTIEAYYGKKDKKFYRLFESGREGALETLRFEHKLLTWGLRLVGFVLMWAGMMMILAPISVFLDVVPIFGTISRSALGFMTGIIAFVLSLITILVSMIVHNIYVLIVVLVLALGGMYWYLRRKKETKKEAE